MKFHYERFYKQLMKPFCFLLTHTHQICFTVHTFVYNLHCIYPILINELLLFHSIFFFSLCFLIYSLKIFTFVIKVNLHSTAVMVFYRNFYPIHYELNTLKRFSLAFLRSVCFQSVVSRGLNFKYDHWISRIKIVENEWRSE